MKDRDDVPDSERDRNTQRMVWIEILIIYAIFILLTAWNWWPQ